MQKGDTLLDESSWSFDQLVEDRDFRFVSRHYRTGTPDGLRLVKYSVDCEGSFGVHVESDIHQLTWFEGAMLGVFADQEFSVIPDTHAMWIPAGTVHDIAALGPATMYCAYLRTGIERSDFTVPLQVEMTDLLRGLLRHLAEDLDEAAGLRGRAVLIDSLESSCVSESPLRYPAHPAARLIAERIVTEPGRRESLEDAARAQGLSARTIRRIFLVETGKTFQQWSAAARLSGSLELVKEGASLEDVAHAVGFSSASGFNAAFRNHFGLTPGQYRRGDRSR